MKIATWNVNSLKARQAYVESWIAEAQPDVLCLQETKMKDAVFPADAFRALGYDSAHFGNGQWNGVAILSRVGIESPACAFDGEDPADVTDARIVSARCGGVYVSSVYVPNGREVGSEHYAFKLRWLADLRRHLESTTSPDEAVAVCGDFNVAPDDRDVWDPAALEGMTHVSPPEREAWGELERWGLVDAFRLFHEEGGAFSWWDFRGGAFHKGEGMRIDLVMVSAPLAARATGAVVDRNARKKRDGLQPSDHAPVIAEFAES